MKGNGGGVNGLQGGAVGGAESSLAWRWDLGVSAHRLVLGCGGVVRM